MQGKSLAAIGALLALTASAYAQQAPQPVPPVPGAPARDEAPAAAPQSDAGPAIQRPMSSGGFIAEQTLGDTLAGDLIGAKVTDISGKKVGEISDLILDADHRAVGVVLAIGGFLGIGEHKVGLDWDQLAPASGDKGLAVKLPLDALQHGPAYKTLADIQAEREAERMRKESLQQPGPLAPKPQP
jgi:hypothetical protein